MAIDTSACVQQIHDIGYCILRGHFPVEAVEAFHGAFGPIADEYLSENAEQPNRGPNRHYIALPLRPPLYHPSFFDNDDVHAIVTEILGEGAYIDQFASDTPFKDSVHQEIHSDLGLLFDEEPDLSHPPALLAMNWPLVDVTPERGPFQVAEATHRLPKAETIERIKVGDVPLKPLLMDVGDVLIRDPRCLHRGSPNVTDTPRPVAVTSFMRTWYTRERVDAHPIPRSVFDNFSDREKQVFRRFVIDESK